MKFRTSNGATFPTLTLSGRGSTRGDSASKTLHTWLRARFQKRTLERKRQTWLYTDGVGFWLGCGDECGALEQAAEKRPGFDPGEVIGIGVDTTGSTPIPVNEAGTPLALTPEFADNLDAHVWLWKDHTAYQEADQITQLASEMRPQYLAKCGGTYSSEWWWSKILRCKNAAPEVFAAAHSWIEHCDWLPAVLTGNENPSEANRGVCAAGHKAMYAKEWGGLPDKEFLAALDPDLADLRDRLYEEAHASDVAAGNLTSEWAAKHGLKDGIPVAEGAFDAHMGAVGSGVKEGTLVKILGTSTCDITVLPADRELGDVP